MSLEEKKELTKGWISLMLYPKAQPLEYLIKEGCKIMVYGWNYDEFVGILKEMQDEGSVIYNRANSEYSLSNKGLFNVKKISIIPLLNLTENADNARMFIEKNKENCDYQFIQGLSERGSQLLKERYIVEYAQDNYAQIANVLSLIVRTVASGVTGQHFPSNPS